MMGGGGLYSTVTDCLKFMELDPGGWPAGA